MAVRRMTLILSIGAFVVAAFAFVVWWSHAHRVRPLIVAMGDRPADIRQRSGVEINENENFDSSWSTITGRHQLTVQLPTGPYSPPISRYTALDFQDHRLYCVLTNPRPKVLSFDEARALYLDLCKEFSALGWEVFQTPFPDSAWAEPFRAESGRPQLDLAYFTKGAMLAELTLKLLQWRGDADGGLVRLPPGLAFVTNPFAVRALPSDAWLLDFQFLATDLANDDHTIVFGFERFRRTHLDERTN